MIALLALSAAFAQDVLPSAPAVHVLGDDRELPAGAPVWTAGVLVNLRDAPGADATIARRLPAATRAVVTEDMGAWVEVRVGGATGWVARELLSTMGRVVDLDADGVNEHVVVARTDDGATRAWLREGDRVQQVVIHPYPEPSLGGWEVVPAAEAGVTLLRVNLDQPGCGAYPVVWLSYAGDTLRTALEVVPWTDGAQGESYDVRFEGPGRVSVRREAYGEIEPVVTERACLLGPEGVYHCG